MKILSGMRKWIGVDLVSAYDAELMSLRDRAASLLAAGVHAADEGAGWLKRMEVVSEDGEMGDNRNSEGSTDLPDTGRVLTRSGP